MILVVGATGRLGRAVTVELLARGHRVRAGGRTPSKAGALAALGAEPVAIDLRNPAGFPAALNGVEQVVTAVQGLTARRADSIARIDLDGHRKLIDASVAAGVKRFIHVSAKDADTNHPAPFLRAKAEVEQHLAESVAKSGMAHTILRPSAFMDLYAHDIIGKPVLAGKKVRLLGDGTAVRNLVTVNDVAAAAVSAVEGRLPDGIVEVVGASNASEREIAALYGRLSGQAVRVSSLSPGALDMIARVIGPFHAGVRNLLLFGRQMEQYGSLAADASGMKSIIGRDPEGLYAFVQARVAEFARNKAETGGRGRD